MSEVYDTSSPLDLYSGAKAAREFYLHPAARKDGQLVEPSEGESALPAEQPIECQCAPYFSLKPVVDRLITAALLPIALPLMMVIGVAIMIADGLPVFYRQTRVGKRGRKYRMWKFRTMCRNAESKTGAVWSTDSDPRVTTLGRWLRCSHLDELPQFFNVLVGDMNLIGPRPERPEFIRELARQLPSYEQRLKARPGITGLAQLRLGYDQSVADVQKKLTLDLEYIESTSFVRDAKIVLSTFPYIATRLLGKWKTVPDNGEDNEIGNDDVETDDPLHRPDPAASPIDLVPHLFPNVSACNSSNVVPQASEHG